MFGIKWLWKSNKTKIDTSNFVSREFFSTTLQDYVNRDLLNTTLSNELSVYPNRTEFNLALLHYPTKKQLNTTLTDYVQTNTLNTTLADYVQTNTLNTTLADYVQTSSLNTTLNNYVSSNTAQSISGAKTFTEGVLIHKNPVPLTLKATDNNKTYIVYKDTANNSNFSLGANSTQTSLEVNRGDLLIQTQQQNKTISFETGTIKTNRARLEFGTEINAGYGGGAVKFIPEDNSTKTLQFYNSQAGDTRRFNLLVPEPSNDNSPATKRYVDTKETAINSQISTLQNSISSKLSIRQLTYKLAGNSVIGGDAPEELPISTNRWGLALPASINIRDVLNVSFSLPAERSLVAPKGFYLTYCSGFVNTGVEQVVIIVENRYYDGVGGTITPEQITINITLINRG